MLKLLCKRRKCQTRQQVPIAADPALLCRSRRSSTLALVRRRSAAHVVCMNLTYVLRLTTCFKHATAVAGGFGATQQQQDGVVAGAPQLMKMYVRHDE